MNNNQKKLLRVRNFEQITEPIFKYASKNFNRICEEHFDKRIASSLKLAQILSFDWELLLNADITLTDEGITHIYSNKIKEITSKTIVFYRLEPTPFTVTITYNKENNSIRFEKIHDLIYDIKSYICPICFNIRSKCTCTDEVKVEYEVPEFKVDIDVYEGNKDIFDSLVSFEEPATKCETENNESKQLTPEQEEIIKSVAKMKAVNLNKARQAALAAIQEGTINNDELAKLIFQLK